MYTEAKKKARFYSNKPTLTDQSQAEDTDLNVILKKYQITGRAPGARQTLPHGDYTAAPQDLAGHFELAKSVKDLQASLPEHLRTLTPEQILQLDNKQLGMYNAYMTDQANKRKAAQENQHVHENATQPSVGPDRTSHRGDQRTRSDDRTRPEQREHRRTDTRPKT